MDPLKRTLKLEKKEKEHEQHVKDILEKNKNLEETLKDEANMMKTFKKNLFFENFTRFEKKLVEEINSIKALHQNVKKDDITYADFKKTLSDLILSLGNIDEYRKEIKKHIDFLLKEERKIISELKKKFHDEDEEFFEKVDERTLRDEMGKPQNVNKYMQKMVDLGVVDADIHRQLEALNDAEENLDKLRKDAVTERDLAKYLLVEMRKVLGCNMREGFLIRKISRSISKHKLLDKGNFPEDNILETLKQDLESLMKLVTIEIALVERIPGDLIDLEKEELLDKKDLKFLKELNLISDIKPQQEHLMHENES